MKMTTQLSEALLGGLGQMLGGGFMYWFAGPVPDSADDALDMVNDHTQVLMLSVDGDGTTGLGFADPVGTVLAKNPGEVWQGTVEFEGAEDGEATLAPTFFRICPAGDDGREFGDGPRVQGTIGGPSSNADIRLSDGSTVTANGTNTRSLPIYSIDLVGVA